MLATASSSVSLAASAPVFLHVGAEAGRMALDWTIKMEKEESPFWYSIVGCWFALPNKTFKTILLLMTVNLLPCGHPARLLVPPPQRHHRQRGQMPPMSSAYVNI